jgi:hypothetical protein
MKFGSKCCQEYGWFDQHKTSMFILYFAGRLGYLKGGWNSLDLPQCTVLIYKGGSVNKISSTFVSLLVSLAQFFSKTFELISEIWWKPLIYKSYSLISDQLIVFLAMSRNQLSSFENLFSDYWDQLGPVLTCAAACCCDAEPITMAKWL